MRNIIVLTFLCLSVTIGHAAEDVTPNERSPKLLLVTTTTSTSTMSTNFVCYVGTALVSPVGCKRKKRTAWSRAQTEDEDVEEAIEPSGVQHKEVEVEDPAENALLAGSQSKVDDESLQRDAKFLNYFMTVTKTFTFTTWTATSTLGSIYCTPQGWDMGACSGYTGKKK